MDSSELQSIFPSGTLIAKRYEVVEFLGTQGHAASLNARDHVLDEELSSMKVFIKDAYTSQNEFARFKNEVILARRLAHPNIVRLYDFGTAGDGCYYISQEYVEGKPLSKYIKERHTSTESIPVEECLFYLYEIALALCFAHEQGVIHRDLRPDNILILEEETGSDTEDSLVKPLLKLSNFGLARSTSAEMGLTRTGEIVGNIHYMAPEQLRCEPLTPSVDMYAYGIVAFELLCGRKPFDASDQTSIATMHITASVPSAKELRPDLPTWCDEFIAKCMEKSPEDRFQSFDEILDELGSRLGLSSTSLKSVVTKKKQKKKLSLRSILTPLLLLFIIGFSYLAYSNNLFSIKEEYGVLTEEQKKKALSQSLLTSVLTGDDQEVFRLLKEGVPTNTSDARGVQIASLAARYGQAGVLYTILEHDPSVINLKDTQGKTPLMHALIAKEKDVIELLLKYDPDLGVKDNAGLTAKEYAKRAGISIMK